MKSYPILALLLLALFVTPAARAQDTVPRVENRVLRLNLLITPKIEGEFAISQTSTLGARLGTELFAYDEWILDYYLVLLPSVDAYYRYYYNLDRRTARGKRISGNSGNYVALTALYANGNPLWSERPDASININNLVMTGPVYGLQRTYGKGFCFNLEFGVGYGYADNGSSEVIPLASARLGWAFGL